MSVAIGGSILSCAIIALGISALFGALHAVVVPFSFPLLGQPHFELTRFTGFLTLLLGVVALPTSIYSASYMRRYLGHYAIGGFTGGYLLLLLSMVGIFAAADVVSFLVAWEIMTVASCALVSYEWRRLSRVRAAVAMLVMSEFGTLAAILAFLLAAQPAHSLDFASIERHAHSLSPQAVDAIVALSFFGFGVKAGLLPFNAWLPRAHPEAPANLSALLSAVILNLGLYGILLVNFVLVPQGAMLFGILALAVGSLSAIIGILYATIEDDLKRMLAYSSIENIGIVVAAFGAGGIFFALRRFDLAALGFGAGLWHMLNHSLYKSLLFLGAGAIDARAGTRRVNQLGGLARVMPVTALCFLIGSLAIAAVPPLNGFASEWLTLETLLRSAELGPLAFKIGFVLAGALLALTAALAVTCFVKNYAMTFLSSPRSAAASGVRSDLSAAAGIGMAFLAALCVLAGLFPAHVAQVVDVALPGSLRGQLAQALVPPFLVRGGGGLPSDFLRDFTALGAGIGNGVIPGRGLVLLHRGATANPVVFAMSSTYLAAFSLIILAFMAIAVRVLVRRRPRSAHVWAGGIEPIPPEFEYTATGFSNPVRVIFDAIFHPRTTENTREAIDRHFRVAITRDREDVFVADRIATNPPSIAVRFAANAIARLHHGRLEGYVFYALGALVVAIVAIAL